ncbi:MAG: type methyltransferase subunit [Rhodopila sp.]|nr:type methyltransferase subunit [Rhodopila sp.]
MARDKSNGLLKERKLRDRRGEVLFIEARELGRMETRTLKVLDDGDVARVADTYHAWRELGGRYADVPGFARAASLAEIAAKGYALTPGRYVGAEAAAEESESFDARMRRLTDDLAAQMEKGVTIDVQIREHWRR